MSKPSVALDEVDRQYRVVDQMITMHSVMRDRNRRRALIVDLVNFGVSLVLVATVFADDQILAVIGVSESLSHYLMGGSSLAVFFLSIVTLRIDWKQQAEKHQDAHLKLAVLKAKLRSWDKPDDEIDSDTIRSLQIECRHVMAAIHPIPDSKFNSLKAIHLRKIEISRALSQNPGASAILLHLKIVLTASFRALRGVKSLPKE